MNSPDLPSSNRLVTPLGSASTTLCAFLLSHLAELTGVAFVDPTALEVRDLHHRVFRDIAMRCETSTEWFFGFKDH